MRKIFKIAAVATVIAGSTAMASTSVDAAPGGHGGVGGGFHGGGFHGGGFHGAGWHGGGWHGGWGGWHGGWRGGWGGWRGGWGGWRGGWGCCGWGWGLGWGLGWGWGVGYYWGAPWYWGADYYDPYVYDDGPDYLPAPYGDDYGQPPQTSGSYGYGANGSYGSTPAPTNNYNCSAWRWDESTKKYVQVRAACN